MRVAPYVPLSAIFPEERGGFASFCAMVRTLSRTDAIFWCARLNLILSNPQNTDVASKQRYCIERFCDAQEIERGKQFEKEHPGATPFSREQMLELMRWTCFLADDLPGDGETFNDPEVRRRFLKASLIAGELWGDRVFRSGLPVTGDSASDRLRSIVTLRAAVSERARRYHAGPGTRRRDLPERIPGQVSRC